MKKKKSTIYTAVVIGCGRIGATFEMDPHRPKPASHAASFQVNKRTKLVAVVDVDEKLAKKAGSYYGVPFYTNVKECLEREMPDIIAIAAPPQMHEALVRLALAHEVRGIICEKPLAHTERSANAIRAMVQKAQITFMVNHQRRFFPIFKKLQKEIASGALGRIEQVTGYYNNGLYNNGTHTIDTLRFLLGSECSWVFGMTNNKNSLAPQDDCNVDGLVGFKSGTVASLQSIDVGAIGIHDFTLIGDRCEVSIKKYGYRVEYRSVRASPLFAGSQEIRTEAKVAEDVRSMLSASTEHLVHCMDGAEESGSTAEDGLQTMRVLNALIKSARMKKLIKL